MAVDQSGLEFSSNWDIDQIYPVVTASIPAGTTTVTTFTGNPPIFDVLAKPSGYPYWVQPGQNGIYFESTLTFNAWISGNSIVAQTDMPCDIRLYMWADKVGY
jgi:hypothetical protein